MRSALSTQLNLTTVDPLARCVLPTALFPAFQFLYLAYKLNRPGGVNQRTLWEKGVPRAYKLYPPTLACPPEEDTAAPRAPDGLQ